MSKLPKKPKPPFPPSTPQRKRKDLGAGWTESERAEIDALAELKGVKPTQIIRMAVKKYLLDAKREEERNAKNLQP
jgi:hypothetical protein